MSFGTMKILKNTPYDDLLEVCAKMVISLNNEQIDIIEGSTRGQSTSHMWIELRSGRITASSFKSVIKHSSLTVIKGVCYPQSVFFLKTKFMRYKTWEGALECYIEIMKKKHTNVSITECVFFISEKQIKLGESPDALISGGCCGWGYVEIKCSYIY